MNYYIPFYTICGIGILYLFVNQTKPQKPKLVDTSKWLVNDWRLQVILSIMILENPTILKNVNKESDAFKYFVEIRKHLIDNKQRKLLLEELTNKNLLNGV